MKLKSWNNLRKSVQHLELFLVAVLLALSHLGSPLASSRKRPLIGLIDTGFDIRHPDLRIGGRSRILMLWDQRDSSRFNGPDGRTSVYTQEDIDSSYHGRDTEGHGTAVASVIFSEDYGSRPPDADLICVCLPADGDPGRAVDAISFIEAVADSTGRPYVINLSVGFPSGARDGQTDELEYRIGELFKTDTLQLFKQVIASAGNSNFHPSAVNDLRTEHLSLRSSVALVNRRCHARGNRPGAFRVNLQVTPLDADDSCVVELWYPAATPYKVRVETPGQDVITSRGQRNTWIPDLGKLTDQFGMVEITDRGLIQGPGPEPARWASTKIVLMDDTTGYGGLSGGTWTIDVLSGMGTWDAYITAVGPADCVKAVVLDDFSNEAQLSVGANVPEAICVGSYNPCDTCRWQTLGGRGVIYDAYLPGHTISHFSSRGPTRAGFDKPDVYAPGQCCRVAMSGDLDSASREEIDSNYLRTSDGLHYVTEGTSYAAPYVTSLVARMIALRPCLQPEEIKHILTSTSDYIFDGSKLCLLVNSDHAIKMTGKRNCK